MALRPHLALRLTLEWTQACPLSHCPRPLPLVAVELGSGDSVWPMEPKLFPIYQFSVPAVICSLSCMSTPLQKKPADLWLPLGSYRDLRGSLVCLVGSSYLDHSWPVVIREEVSRVRELGEGVDGAGVASAPEDGQLLVWEVTACRAWAEALLTEPGPALREGPHFALCPLSLWALLCQLWLSLGGERAGHFLGPVPKDAVAP